MSNPTSPSTPVADVPDLIAADVKFSRQETTNIFPYRTINALADALDKSRVDRERLQAALEQKTGEAERQYDHNVGQVAAIAKLEKESWDLWGMIRSNERAAYDADNGLDVAQLDAMSLDLSRQVGEHLAEIAELREHLRAVQACVKNWQDSAISLRARLEVAERERNAIEQMTADAVADYCGNGTSSAAEIVDTLSFQFHALQASREVGNGR